MARTVIVATQITPTTTPVVPPGQTTPSGSGVGNGIEFLNDGRTFVEVENVAAGSPVATILTQATLDGYAIADQTFALPASNFAVIGPFAKGIFNTPPGDAAGEGKVQIDFDVHTNVRVRVYRI